MTMIAFDIDGVRFNYRAAGVCIEEGHVLLNKIEGHDFWFLPGGRCDAGESSDDTLRREMIEELAVPVQVGRVLWVIENFFGLAERPYHELGIYYEMTLPPGTAFAGKDRTHTVQEGSALLQLQWFALTALSQIRLVPSCLQEGLHNLPSFTQHIIARDAPLR